MRHWVESGTSSFLVHPSFRMFTGANRIGIRFCALPRTSRQRAENFGCRHGRWRKAYETNGLEGRPLPLHLVVASARISGRFTDHRQLEENENRKQPVSFDVELVLMVGVPLLLLILPAVLECPWKLLILPIVCMVPGAREIIVPIFAKISDMLLKLLLQENSSDLRYASKGVAPSRPLTNSALGSLSAASPSTRMAVDRSHSIDDIGVRHPFGHAEDTRRRLTYRADDYQPSEQDFHIPRDPVRKHHNATGKPRRLKRSASDKHIGIDIVEERTGPPSLWP